MTPGSADSDSELREVLDTSKRGAPAAGEAVADIFSTNEIFSRILATADDELARTNRMLFLSGVVAGLLVGLTFLGHVALGGGPASVASRVAGSCLYPIGFVFIVIGRHQLFTENTLTPVTLVLTRLASLPRLVKLWALVYLANLVGAVVAGVVFAHSSILDPDAIAAARAYGADALTHSWTALLSKGIVAGWMVAGMVWLAHAVRDSMARLVVVYLVMFLIPVFGLYHCISGTCEISYYTALGGTDAVTAFFRFVAPVTIGNVIGGVVFVAVPNYFQTARDRLHDVQPLSWREWLFGSEREAGANQEPILNGKHHAK